ncbi:MAG TPA: PH domain-containing protein [Aeromicrobium sp.]|nr:PH domain-containing protein [Aeromicrobium sp.]
MSEPPVSGPAVGEQPWQRLDRRMLIVEPIRAIKDFFPLIIAAFLFGRSDFSDLPWQLLVAVFPIGWGLLRFWATRFRISEGRLELQTGLLNRQRRSTSLDRIRTVDFTASPLHRVLGLTSVKMGTGISSVGDGDLVLDGLAKERAEQMRSELLAGPSAQEIEETAGSDLGQAPRTGEIVAQLDPKWAKYGPLTTTGLVAPLSLIGFLIYLGSEFGSSADFTKYRLDSLAIGLIAFISVVLFFVLAIVVPIAGYLVANWGFRLTREPAAWSVSRGLFTTRRTHLDRERVAGVSIGEELPLRLAGGARLSAISTGINLLSDDSSVLLPAASRGVVDKAAAEVLGVQSPVSAQLRKHGSAAATRRWTRALIPVLGLAVAAGVATWLGYLPTWLLLALPVLLVLAAVVAWDRVRMLGHLLTESHLVFRSGSLSCDREILRTDQIIGWNFTSNPFQRRVGLANLVATTAGGSQSITAIDIPLEAAVAVANEAVPGLASQFLAEPTITKTT